MSLPINMKFEVPKHKAPAPTKNPLWPALTPAPVSKVALRPEKAEDSSAKRPITPLCPVSPKAKEGRRAVVFTSPRRGRSHGRSLLVKFALPGIPLFLILTMINVGCTTEKPKAEGSVLDVGPQQAQVSNQPVPAAEPAPYAGPTYKSPAYKPAPASNSTRVAAKPAYVAPAEPVAVEPVAVAAAGKTYTVQKGDTLTSIARAQYGDGNKWKKIAAANPNMNPDAVKVGQKIVIP
ncbi:LysM peptidoglycan-binding domain-containing protein [Humisphaera borealis]|uniref:LysM peptidoglycan-binding domain-containing protein n=1 Tax=Humisphaera borealis TaxID=2807512 RepID=A0A7M2X2Y2_9BACT|nr:LysM peptidoglycan-binding domain-containing protein [Humisphaera borealis]QOV92126.1 LysM peptidoglycan-binding domain-containing protein [Humisphaera borealis]